MNVDFLPPHLREFVSPQDGVIYSAVDHAVWRYILHQLYEFLKDHAHPSYVEGIPKTGITLDQIPSIEGIDQHLQRFGWRAVPVSGFIPPKVFMEMQALGVLPIAREMRTIEHLGYTPAPDIVHEAAGHAPLLIDPDYRAYIQEYAQLARKAIVSRWDMELYRAIRHLSDVKENPASSQQDIAQAEQALREAYEKARLPSEGAWLARMNWWTAEYGLIGNLRDYRIYGAGLLSSVAESRHAFSPEVLKLPLTLDCIHVPYDITRMQPQLFVTPNFEWLRVLLRELESQMSFRIGGFVGLTRALMAQTPVTVGWDSGIQVSGILEQFLWDDQKQKVFYLKFKGPCQVGEDHRILPEHDTLRHPEGFSLPCGLPDGYRSWLDLGYQLQKRQGQKVDLRWEKWNMRLSGIVERFWTGFRSTIVGVCLKQAQWVWKDQQLFAPEWGDFDWFWVDEVSSVAGEVLNPQTLRYGLDDYVIRVQKPKSKRSQVLEPFFERVHLALQGIKPLLPGEKESLNQSIQSVIDPEDRPIWNYHLNLL